MIILRVVFFPIKNLVPKGDIVIIQTYSPNVYCENTKYLFEYLSRNTPHQVYWITHHPEIQEHLESKNLKYLCKQRPFQLIWTTLRAKIVIDSGSSFFNFLGLVGKRVVKISTFHGSGPKITTPLGNSLDETLSEVFKMNRFDYVNFASRYASVMIGKQNLKLPHQKVIVFGYPRCDHFFDELERLAGFKRGTGLLLGRFFFCLSLLFFTPSGYVLIATRYKRRSRRKKTR